jgi:tetratricopeptide (TPR) repeat protein
VLAAARDAMRAFAYEDAAALCERALEDAPSRSPRAGELLLQLGEARVRAGDITAAREAFRAVEGDPELLARAALGFSGLGVTIIAVDREAVTLLGDALQALPHDHPLRARLLARLAIETYYESRPEQRKALGDEAVALARGDARLDALNARHAALWSAQYLDERLQTADEMIALASSHDDAERELQGRNWRVVDLMEQGDVEEARREIAAHEALAARLRLPAYEWWGPMWRASLAISEGRFGEAQELIARFTAIDDPNARLYGEIQTFVAAIVRGIPVEFAVDPIERETGRPAEYAYRAGYSWILAIEGRRDEARRQIALSVAAMKDDMNRLAALAELTEALAILGEPGPAARLYDLLAPYAGRNIVNGRGAAGYGSAEHHLGTLAALLGRAGAAQRHFERALAENRRLGAKHWLERSERGYAQVAANLGAQRP